MLNIDVISEATNNAGQASSTYKMMNRDFPNALYKNPQFLRNQ